jgi:hypothetical protein
LSEGSWNSDDRSWHDVVQISELFIGPHGSISCVCVTSVVNNVIVGVFFLMNALIIIFISVGKFVRVFTEIGVDLEE